MLQSISTAQAATTPTFSPAAGAVSNPTTVTLSSNPECSAYIHHNTTGSPLVSDPTGTYSVTGAVTLYGKTIGCPGHNDSSVGSAAYTITAGNTHTWVQSKGSKDCNGTPVTSLTCAYDSNVTTGNLLITVATSSASTATISNSVGTASWTKIWATEGDANGCFHDANSIGYICAWYAVAGSTAAETVQISASSGTIYMTVQEFHTTGAGWTLDVEKISASSFSTTYSSGASAAVAGAGELIIGYPSDADGNEVFTTSLTTTDANAGGVGRIGAAYTLAGGTGAQTVTFTQVSGNTFGLAGMAAFKP